MSRTGHRNDKSRPVGWHNPMRPQISLIVVEYDYIVPGTTRVERRTKEFTHNGKARSFYETKMRAGKNPRVVNAVIVNGNLKRSE